MAVRSIVVTVQHDRRGVVVQLAAVDPELADRSQHQLAQQRGAIGVEQLVQRAPDAVIVEQPRLPGREAQQPRLEPGSPAGQAVERLARHAQIARPARRPPSRPAASCARRRRAGDARACPPDPSARRNWSITGNAPKPAGCPARTGRPASSETFDHLSESTSTLGQTEMTDHHASQAITTRTPPTRTADPDHADRAHRFPAA